MNRIWDLWETAYLSKIHVNDAIENYKESNFNRHTFYKWTMDMLREKRAFDPENYDKKTLDDAINKIFALFDKSMNGIVDLEEIALGCSFLCKGSIGDKSKILF